jgi:two-component system, NarL family, nitrate/nitrite response regulator NarL
VALRCLIVDDNADFLAAACALLSRRGISVVGLASSAAEAVQQAGKLRPDVALVDIDLGGESGFDVARLLSDTPGIESLPVVLISTYAEKDFVDLIAASPAIGFVSKSDLSGKAIMDVLAAHANSHAPRRATER